MNGPQPPRRRDEDRSPDPLGSLKVAALAILAWGVIGVVLRATTILEFEDELFAGALLVPALVGVFLSIRAVNRGPSPFLATIGLIVNVMLVVGAILLWLAIQPSS